MSYHHFSRYVDAAYLRLAYLQCTIVLYSYTIILPTRTPRSHKRYEIQMFCCFDCLVFQASERELRRRIAEQAVIQHQRLTRESLSKSPRERSNTVPAAVGLTTTDRHRKDSHDRDIDNHHIERLRKERDAALREIERLKVSDPVRVGCTVFMHCWCICM